MMDYNTKDQNRFTTPSRIFLKYVTIGECGNLMNVSLILFRLDKAPIRVNRNVVSFNATSRHGQILEARQVWLQPYLFGSG